MARAKGREEFFEVFRNVKKESGETKKDQKQVAKPRELQAKKAKADAPPEDLQQKYIEHDHVQFDREKPSSAVYYKTSVCPTSTEGIGRSALRSSIVLRRDSIIYAAISVLLLLIIAYALGYDRGSGKSSDLVRTPVPSSSSERANRNKAPLPSRAVLPAVSDNLSKSPVSPAISDLPESSGKVLAGKYEIRMLTLPGHLEKGKKVATDLNETKVFQRLNLKAYAKMFGNNVVVSARGNFQSKNEARSTSALREIKRMKYNGDMQFRDAYFVTSDSN